MPLHFVRYFLLLAAIFLSACHSPYYNGPPSDHYDGHKFFNPYSEHKDKTFLRKSYELFNLWKSIYQAPWEKPYPTFDFSNLEVKTADIEAFFINHSTILVETKKTNFLFDPIYSYRASPVSFIGPARITEPGIKFKDLPRINVVMISHNHYDHLDIKTLKRLNKAWQPLFIVPLGNQRLLRANGIDKVKELDWWQSININGSIITMLPAQHDSQRGLFDFNKTLWASYGLKTQGKKIYFAGDTAYGPHFKAIKKRWGSPDFSFIPIGAYQPRDILKTVHVNPYEAVKSHIDLHSKRSLGIHWRTFQLGAEHIDQPLIDLKKARKRLGIPEQQFIAVPEGQPVAIR